MPDTLAYIKNKGTKVIVFLGDDPNFLYPSKKTFLLTVMNADLIITPDSGWIDGLKMLDISDDKIFFTPVGTDEYTFFPMTPSEEQLIKYKSQLKL